jgi:hypothetical protein
MVQGWYQGGISVFDWTDPARPVEIAYFDRGPMDSTRLRSAGSWSAYWYNGYIYSSEIARGLDVFELVPSGFLTQSEIDAARTVGSSSSTPRSSPSWRGRPRSRWRAPMSISSNVDADSRPTGSPPPGAR